MIPPKANRGNISKLSKRGFSIALWHELIIPQYNMCQIKKNLNILKKCIIYYYMLYKKNMNKNRIYEGGCPIRMTRTSSAFQGLKRGARESLSWGRTAHSQEFGAIRWHRRVGGLARKTEGCG